LGAAITVAVPFIGWDVLVTGRHWFFNVAPTAIQPLGLPLGEWAFFVTVPLACAFTWEMLTGGVDPAPARGTSAIWTAVVALLAMGGIAWGRGLEYTAVACGALA